MTASSSFMSETEREAVASKLRVLNGAHAPEPWPDPRPIRAELPPAPPFDAALLLPPPLAGYVLDEADRMPCPPDYVGASLVVALGATIGSRCALKPKRRDDWLIVPNLWGAVVGDPSAKKTPALARGLAFLDRLEADEADRHERRLVAFKAEQAAFEARKSAVEKAMADAARGKLKERAAETMASAVEELKSLVPPDEPAARRYRANDSTVAKLGEILSKSPDGLLVFRDELVGLLSSWDAQGHEGDRAFYLEAWNGLGSFAIDRIGRGSLLVPRLTLSVFGGIQPEMLGSYLSRVVHAGDNDGRIQRFQVAVFPDAVAWEWRDRYPVRGAREAVRDVFLRLAAFDPVDDGAVPADEFQRVPAFAFDDAAQELFVEWSTDLHCNLIANEPDALLRQHFSKFEKLFGGLALILHVAMGSVGPVGVATAARAAAWTQYLAQHARRIYGLADVARVSAAQTLVKRLKAGKLADDFTARDVVRKGWTSLSTTREAEAALATLEEFGYVASFDDADREGRPTTRYRINPAIQRVPS
jgi:hypothetical protein